MLTDLKSNPELRATARERLKGNWGKAILTVLVYFILTILINGGSKFEDIGWIVSILALILNGAWSAGLLTYFIHVARQEPLSIKLLFSQLPRLIPFFILLLIQGILIILWTLLLIVPGIIASIRYSQAFYILLDHPEMKASEAINRSKEMMKDQKWKYFLLILSFAGWYILIMAALLILSALGLQILGIIVFGIGILALMPYIYTTQSIFYDDLNKNTP
ncbi:DUF975 family protein [Paenibacillus psychroresistens]|uniref:DUF975 family protein n=1 Tax=Paenibacillus psychroresistens TaxID=1778678 RepID=A0A6B8R9G1_9BACL|nr:DUF975 family protein [Paenibacillus psychroresistens]QGQ93561.1 DUF975 family protein [Paenibacillus psychroresistens]